MNNKEKGLGLGLNQELRKPHKHTLKMFLVGKHKHLHDIEEYNGNILKHIIEGLYHYLLKEEVSFEEETVVNGDYVTSTLTYKDEVIKIKYSTLYKEVYILENHTNLSDNMIKEEVMIAITINELR